MWIGAQEDESIRALHRAIELGITFIDTARGYGERRTHRRPDRPRTRP
jgi:aryl-alcohol dehydrogenase-like predicted oxidoreductase